MLMAELEQQHVHKMELWSGALVTIGQAGGFLLCMAAIIGAIILAMFDKRWEGLVSLVSGLGLLLGGGYVGGRNRRSTGKYESKSIEKQAPS